MKKAALITIVGTQRDEYGEENKVHLITAGTFFVHPHGIYLIYNESEVTGMAGATTTLKVQKQKVVLNRMGTTGYRQEFELGMLHEGLYHTDFGTLRMGVQTNKVEISMDEHGGSIYLEYELQIDRSKLSENQLHITVKEENQR